MAIKPGEKWITATSICAWPARRARTPPRCWTQPPGQTAGPQAAACSLPAIPDPATAALADLQASGRALWGARSRGKWPKLWRASLRLRLTVETLYPSAALRQAQGGSSGPELAALPWELPYDPTVERCLTLDPGYTGGALRSAAIAVPPKEAVSP